MRFGVNMFLTEEKWSLSGTFSGIFALVGGGWCVREYVGGRELRLFRGNDGGAGEGGEEGGLVGVADRDAVGGDDDVVALDGFDLVEADDEGFVNSDEIGCGEGVLEGFHPHKGEDRRRVACQVDLHVVFQAFDVGDLVEVDLLEAVLGLDEDAFGATGGSAYNGGRAGFSGR